MKKTMCVVILLIVFTICSFASFAYSKTYVIPKDDKYPFRDEANDIGYTGVKAWKGDNTYAYAWTDAYDNSKYCKAKVNVGGISKLGKGYGWAQTPQVKRSGIHTVWSWHQIEN